MRAGELKKRIEILRPANFTNEYGEESEEELVSLYSVRAQVTYSDGSLSTSSDDYLVTYSITFTIRNHIKDLNEKDIIGYNNNKYKIVSIVPNEARQLINIKTELIDE